MPRNREAAARLLNTAAALDTESNTAIIPCKTDKIKFHRLDESCVSLLDLLPQNFRGTIGDLFYRAVRAGKSDPDDIIAEVGKAVQRWQRKSVSPARYQDHDLILEILALNIKLAREFVAQVIYNEAQPAGERATRKRALADEYTAAAMRGKEPSGKQLDYLRGLGYRGPSPKNMAEACQLIGRLKAAKEASK